jgi:hypothetical protein
MTLTDLFGYFMFGQSMFVIGFSVWIYAHYRKTNAEHLYHITLMAVSYSLFQLIIALAITLRIFYEGPTRSLGTGLVVIAVALGNLGLARMWHTRKKR